MSMSNGSDKSWRCGSDLGVTAGLVANRNGLARDNERVCSKLRYGLLTLISGAGQQRP